MTEAWDKCMVACVIDGQMANDKMRPKDDSSWKNKVICLHAKTWHSLSGSSKTCFFFLFFFFSIKTGAVSFFISDDIIDLRAC